MDGNTADPPMAESITDWAQISSLFNDDTTKGDFDLTNLPMDLDFLQPDPNALQMNDFFSLDQNFDFSFQHAPYLSVNDLLQTPLPSDIPQPMSMLEPPAAASFYTSTAAEELAERVRQSAGVMMALPINGPIPADEFGRHSPSLLSVSSPSSSYSGASTPPPVTPPSNVSALASATQLASRPKTSHTNIERKYRTNLNARIQNLRMAVPALRVLENQTDMASSRKVKVNIPYGEIKVKKSDSEEEIVDFVDQRGYVDGVKVARKCSKANVLGKAAEYIHVLKRREARLKREQDGLKALLNGLVGGPALLKEWDREWKQRFGGEEKDELEVAGNQDDVASDEEDEDDEDEGRKRKKPKLAPTQVAKKAPQQPVALADGTVPEKRKRGRPRKVVALPTSSSGPSSPETTQPPPQYLLAAFSLFSLFNSPFASQYHPSSSTSHTHTGTVLSHQTTVHGTSYSGSAWTQVLPIAHLLASLLIFSSVAIPFLGRFFKGTRLPSLAWPSPNLVAPNAPRAVRLASALASEKKGTDAEATELRAVASRRFIDVVKSIFRVKPSLEQTSYQQVAWSRLGELVILRDEPSIWVRLDTFIHLRSQLSWFTAGPTDFSTLALLVYPLGVLGQNHAQTLWQQAKRTLSDVPVRAHERLVLESIELDEAVQLLSLTTTRRPAQRASLTPLAVIAGELVREQLRKSFALIFTKTILGDESDYGLQDADLSELSRRKTINAAKSLGGQYADFGDMLEKLWDSAAYDFDGLDSSIVHEGDGDEVFSDIRALLAALVLYRQIFPLSVLGAVSVLLSPPPSPGGRDARLQQALRRALGCKVFEETLFGSSLEDARDRVVDVLFHCERRRKVLD